jgi:hypothetical protein
MKCKRCGKEFDPSIDPLFDRPSNCCPGCCVNNLIDALGLPTPPALLDPHSKDPALTLGEFHRKLEKAKEENEKDDGVTC